MNKEIELRSTKGLAFKPVTEDADAHEAIQDMAIENMLSRRPDAEVQGAKPFVYKELETNFVYSKNGVACGFVMSHGANIVRMCIAFDPKIEGSIVIIWFDNGNFKLHAIEGDEAEILSSDEIIYPDSIKDWVNNIEIKYEEI